MPRRTSPCTVLVRWARAGPPWAPQGALGGTTPRPGRALCRALGRAGGRGHRASHLLCASRASHALCVACHSLRPTRGAAEGAAACILVKRCAMRCKCAKGNSRSGAANHPLFNPVVPRAFSNFAFHSPFGVLLFCFQSSASQNVARFSKHLFCITQ